MADLEKFFTAGHGELQTPAGHKIQRFTGKPNDTVEADEEFGQTFINNEIKQIKHVIEQPIMKFLHMTAGSINADVQTLTTNGSDYMQLESIATNYLNNVLPDAEKFRDQQSLLKQREDLVQLISNANADATASTQPLKLRQQKTAQTAKDEKIQTALKLVQPLPTLFPNIGATSSEKALDYLLDNILFPQASPYNIDVVGNIINRPVSGTLVDDKEKVMSRLHAVFENDVRRIGAQGGVFSPLGAQYVDVMRQMVKTVAPFPNLQNSDTFVYFRSSKIAPFLQYTPPEEITIEQAAFTAPGNLPPARMAQLGLGEKMDKTTEWDALRWLLENKTSPSEVDMKLIAKLFSTKPINRPDWMTLLHHLMHLFIAPVTRESVLTCRDLALREARLAGVDDPVLQQMTLSNLITHDDIMPHFAKLVGAYIMDKKFRYQMPHVTEHAKQSVIDRFVLCRSVFKYVEDDGHLKIGAKADRLLLGMVEEVSITRPSNEISRRYDRYRQ